MDPMISPAEQAARDELSAYTLTHGDADFIHQHVVDAFAAQHASARAMVSALVRLYEDNAATLTPDPLHSAFHDSHPPAALRVAHLEGLAGA